MSEEIKNNQIPEEIKDICRSCENNIFAQNKGCAFRSLGNEYCDYVLNATKLYLDLQQKVEQLEKENKILKENAEHNDKVVDKVNWENMLLKTTINESTTLIKQLKRSARYQRCVYELDYLLDELSKKVINHE